MTKRDKRLKHLESRRKRLEKRRIKKLQEDKIKRAASCGCAAKACDHSGGSITARKILHRHYINKVKKEKPKVDPIPVDVGHKHEAK